MTDDKKMNTEGVGVNESSDTFISVFLCKN